MPHGGNIITNDIKEGCSIIEKQAELLKIKFGSAWPGENKETEIVSIPGLRGRDPKEISLKNLSRIIHARCTEIINAVFTEIKNYGHDQTSKKLIAGVVITGGGSQLKHIKQLVEYLTGMDTRIGYPNEHLASKEAVDKELNSPIYSTAVGLLMQGLSSRKEIHFVDPLENEEFRNSGIDENQRSSQEKIDKINQIETKDPTENALENVEIQQKSEVDPVARTPKQADWFKRWVDKFIELIDD